jgi:hypothetical protein
VTLRRTDARFALPEPPASALVLDDLAGWRSGLREAGVAATESEPDLVVASEASLREAIARHAPAAIVEGRRAARSLRETYPQVVRLLPIPTLAEPEFLLPVDSAAPTIYAIENLLYEGQVRWKSARNAIVKSLVAHGRFPDLRPVATVATRTAGPPFLISAAERLGVPGDAKWFLGLGRGDALTRAVFHLFSAGSAAPEWVLKFARVPGYRAPFDRDEDGLRLVARFGGGVAARAPTLLGRFEAAGLHASVETAAVGETLTRFLIRSNDRSAKLRAVSAVADWVIGASTQTRQPADLLAGERKRQLEDVLPRWAGRGVPTAILADLPPIDGVLQHNDLGCWNIVSNPSTFTVLDWESAREIGFPLWDLLYFLTDAFIHLDGEWSPSQRDAYTARLFRGETPSSALLFDWLAKGARAAGVPFKHVGAVATLCWLHHGLSFDTRSAAAAEFAPDLPTPPATARRIAEIWLSDPELTPSWDAWLRFCGAG